MEMIHATIAEIVRKFRRLETLPETDITPRQYLVLALLAEGSRTMGEIARCLGATPAVATGVVDRLERKQFVVRDDHHDGFSEEHDHRIIRVYITGPGAAAMERFLASAQAHVVAD